MTTRNHDRTTPRRGRGDDGAALLEFALVAVLLFTLLFGIINFGLILSFKQDVTRAAAEGARGGAVAYPASPGQTFEEAAELAALEDTDRAVRSISGTFDDDGCDTSGMTCDIDVSACQDQPTQQCVTVRVSYAYDEEPLFGSLPFMDGFLPNQVASTSVARINQ